MIPKTNEYKQTWLRKGTKKQLKVHKEMYGFKNISDVIDKAMVDSGMTIRERKENEFKKKRTFFPKI